MELFFEVLADAFWDTVKMLPFLFGAYLLMEYLERRPASSVQRMLSGSRLSPVVGGVLGILPQCGFSAAAANLYNLSLITPGTLLAVFIATSDEALPMLLATPGSYPLMFKLMGIKLALGVVCGLVLDLVLQSHKRIRGDEPVSCGVDHHHHGLVLSALRHTASIGLFIFAVTLVLGGIIELAGQETIASWLMTGSLLQPFAAALVGFIPNCAASVILTQLLLEGSLSLGSALAGLTTGAGVGLLVLVRGSRDRKRLVQFLLLLYVIGVAAGVVTDLVL